MSGQVRSGGHKLKPHCPQSLLPKNNRPSIRSQRRENLGSHPALDRIQSRREEKSLGRETPGADPSVNDGSVPVRAWGG